MRPAIPGRSPFFRGGPAGAGPRLRSIVASSPVSNLAPPSRAYDRRVRMPGSFTPGCRPSASAFAAYTLGRNSAGPRGRFSSSIMSAQASGSAVRYAAFRPLLRHLARCSASMRSALKSSTSSTFAPYSDRCGYAPSARARRIVFGEQPNSSASSPAWSASLNPSRLFAA